MDLHDRSPFIPIIPGCLKRLPRAPPRCLPEERDVKAIQVLREFGSELGCSADEIRQACDLASGFSDIVVVLERPLRDEHHPYNQSFEHFVDSNPTLRHIDELLQFASAGARSIKTTTVVNAFPFQKYENNAGMDRRCEPILAKFLQTKRPRVVLQCVNTIHVDRLETGGTCTVIPSFHPSHAIKYSPYCLDLRIFMMYHFAMAFRYLHEPEDPLCRRCAEMIQHKERINRYRLKEAMCLPRLTIASRISKILSLSY
ncbi:hypothetical protein BJY04DRAFT_72297 [Aspergillus karnatakaensis]|uniref:uncharacterized protein n=1 Tax=Aspergillus karnatakaensis TaxID=1810916 RepID=UPI003CCCC5EE